MTMPSLLQSVPEAVSGYELSPIKGLFSLIIPKERTNLVLNPSFELATTGYTSIASTVLTRTVAQQRRGLYSLSVRMTATNNAGVYYLSSGLAQGSNVVFSLDVFAPGGMPLVISISDTINVIALKKFKGKGYWERIYVGGTTVASDIAGVPHRLILQKDSSTDIREIFTDGWQLEQCSAGELYPTTYIDGDQSGYAVQSPPAYYWNGIAHTSTSTRSGQTRSGGYSKNLNDLGFNVMGIMGLGQIPVANVATPLSIGGALYQRSTILTRDFSLIGNIVQVSFMDLHSIRRALEVYLSTDFTGTQQPLLIRYEYIDQWGDPNGKLLDIPCFYAGGLEGRLDNWFQERLELRFSMFQPYIQEVGEVGAVLGFEDALSSTSTQYYNTATGQWASAQSSNRAALSMLVVGDDVYIGSASFLYKYDSSGNATQIAFATGGIYSLILDPDGVTIYVGGNFNAIGPIASEGLATYNILTGVWTSLNSSITTSTIPAGIFALALGPDNTLYVGGAFDSIAGVTVRSIAKRSPGGVWSKVSAGVGVNAAGSRAVNAIVVGTDNYLYIGGTFSSVDGDTNVIYIGRLNLATLVWDSMGIGSSAASGVFDIAIGQNGIVYVATLAVTFRGLSPTVPGYVIMYMVAWNGSSWADISAGIGSVGSSGNVPLSILITPDGRILIGVGGIAREAIVYQWTGSSWIPLPIRNGAGAGSTANKLAAKNVSQTIYIGRSTANSIISSHAVSIQYDGTAKGYPKFIIKGSGYLYQISNATNGRSIYFVNLQVLAGETLTLITTPGSVSFTSSARGNMLSFIDPASNQSDFCLQPGANVMNVFMDSVGANALIAAIWKVAHQGIEGSIRV